MIRTAYKKILVLNIFTALLVSTYAQEVIPNADKNYVLSETVLKEGILNDAQLEALDHHGKKSDIQYFDGLGRLMLTLQAKASPMGKDLIQPTVYDEFGREKISYLPFSRNNSGAFVEDPVTYVTNFYQAGNPDHPSDVADTEAPYAEKVFDNSPLNRVMEQGAPGSDWQPGTGHTVRLNYTTNQSGEVIEWQMGTADLCRKSSENNGFYPENHLFVYETTDENGNITKEYKDKLGQVILKKSYVEGDSLETCYVYDDFGLLRYVLPPLGTQKLHSVSSFTSSMTDVRLTCYYYEYDGRKRMTLKQLPGNIRTFMVYDNRDRLVLSQDENMRTHKDANRQLDPLWMFTKYDVFNRPIASGLLHANITSQATMQAALDTAYSGASPRSYYEEIDMSSPSGGYTENSYPSPVDGTLEYLSFTYYDKYEFPGMSYPDDAIALSGYSDTDGDPRYFDRVKGLVTGTRTKVLDDTQDFWSTTTHYYDDKYRPIQTLKVGLYPNNEDIEIISTAYSFTGLVDSMEHTQVFAGTETTLRKYFTYDHAGRLLRTQQEITGDATGRITLSEMRYNEIGQLIEKNLGDGWQSVDYRYNIRGWLEQVNNPDDLANDGSGDAQPDLFAMQLLYNRQETGLNETIAPMYNGNISAMTWRNAQQEKKGYAYTYDGINRLTGSDYKTVATGWTDTDAYEEKEFSYDVNGNIQHLLRTGQTGNNLHNYHYGYVGNRLDTLTDLDNDLTYIMGYDANGNLVEDRLRQFTIKYNHLNLPYYFKYSRYKIEYIYDANGTKLARKHNGNVSNYYHGSFVYNTNQELDYLLTEEGMVKKLGSTYTCEYYLKDHLGNNRVLFQAGQATPGQVTEFYPFGMVFEKNNLGDNKYLYNGKELQEGMDTNNDGIVDKPLDWYDYGARMYDPALGRWHTQDLMAEFYYDQSPYNYVTNDPISHIDPNGDFKTKFGAWLWKTFNGGGEILQDKGGEYFVSQQVEYEGEGAGIAVKRTFDWEGRSEGKDLEFEAQKEAFLTQYEFKQTMESMGVEVTYIDDINEARQSMLQIPTMVLLPNVLKATSVATNTTKTGISSVDDLLKAAGKLKRVKGAKQGFVKGNAQDIFNNIVKGGSKVRGNLYRLKDGTLVNLHKSTKTGVQTIDINKAGQVFKIRVQ